MNAKITSRAYVISLTAAFVFLIILSVGAAAYKYLYLNDFTSIYFIPCDETKGACFIDYESCETENTDDCAYSVVSVPTKNLKCENDDGNCLIEFCSSSENNCTFVKQDDDFQSFGIYGELME